MGGPALTLILGSTAAEESREVSTGYIPRRLQYALHTNMKRFNVIVCHRRFGKTIFSINHMIDRALRCPLVMPRFAYIAPTYGQAKRVVWDQLKHYTQNIPGIDPNEADLRVDIPGNKARIMLLSAENPSSLKGIYLDGVILDEYAEMNPAAWAEVIRPTLSDRKGWANFIGTPKGQNNFYKLYEYALNGDPKTGVKDPEWFSALYKASQTGIIDQAELDSARRTMSEEEYEQEFECSFNAGLVGAYFGKELALAEKENRIGTFPYDPQLPVETFWDLGIDDLASVWFAQSLRGRYRLIDYYEVCGASIPEVVAEVRRKNYVFGDWVFPHDVVARDFSTGRSQLQIFHSLGCRPSRVVPRVGTKREGINAARVVFRQCEFDRVKCKRGLDALANYQRKWNSKNNVYEEAPLHNWASNGADAFQQFALGVRPDSRETTGIYAQARSGTLKAETGYNPFGRRSV